MGRIKLEIPEQVIGNFLIPVRITDINYGNHVGNNAFIEVIHEARMQWLHKYGYTELAIEGIGLIMADLAVEFKKESFYGDMLEVELCAGEVSRAGFELFYQIFTKRAGEQILLAKAKTGMICFDYDARKVASVPEKLKQLLAG